jgi:hypothetical protein
MGRRQRDTIRGPNPAVCFSEQPLSAFIQSCRILGRYSRYAIALEKRHLFAYGGRPVIYGDEQLLDRLRDEDKYLWVRYNPIPTEFDQGAYPLDWTHEREWRVRVRRHAYLSWGLTPQEGVPLILPPVHSSGAVVVSFPVILVRTAVDVSELRQGLAYLPPYDGTNGFVRKLYESFDALKIVSLDFVSDRLAAGDTRFARLETIPWGEIPA